MLQFAKFIHMMPSVLSDETFYKLQISSQNSDTGENPVDSFTVSNDRGYCDVTAEFR